MAPVAPKTAPAAAKVAPLASKAAPVASKAAPVASKPAAQPAAGAAKPRLMTSERTVREILPPWHVLQEKMQSKSAAPKAPAVPADQAARELLAAQEAANTQWMPPSDAPEVPPSSGVRMSESNPAALTALVTEVEAEPEAQALPAVPDSMLSFKVYTLAELERRSDGPASSRMSRAAFDKLAPRGPVQWRALLVTLQAFGVASLAWVRTKGGRPDPKVALRQPFDALGDELQRAVEAVDWQKIGIRTGIVVGATLTLLFAVLTAAELTDDLKPGTASRLATRESSLPSARASLDGRGVAPSTNAATNGAAVSTPSSGALDVASAAAPAAAQAPIAGGELDELDPPARSHHTFAPSAKKPVKIVASHPPVVAPHANKSSKLTFRNADAIFKP